MVPVYDFAEMFREMVGQPMAVKVDKVGNGWDVTLQCETEPISLVLWSTDTTVENGLLDPDSPPQYVRELRFFDDRTPGGVDSWGVVLTDRPMTEPFALKYIRVEYENSDQEKPSYTELRSIGPVNGKLQNEVQSFYEVHGFSDVTVESRVCDPGCSEDWEVITKAPTRKLNRNEISAPNNFNVEFYEAGDGLLHIGLNRE